MKFVIFVERIFDDEVFRQLKEFIKKHTPNKVNLYCIAPVNYELMKSEQGYTGTKEELTRLMGERYDELKKMGCKINLHLHLSLRPDKLDLWHEGQMFKEAVEWMNECDFNPTEIMFGWYLYTPISLEIGKRYNLKLNKNKERFHIHDYQLNNVYSIMNILANIRGLMR